MTSLNEYISVNRELLFENLQIGTNDGYNNVEKSKKSNTDIFYIYLHQILTCEMIVGIITPSIEMLSRNFTERTCW